MLIANFKYTFLAEMVPICKDDVVVLHDPNQRQAFGGCSPLLLCLRVASHLLFLDPMTCKLVEMSAKDYWRNPFKTVFNNKLLSEFVIINVEKVDSPQYQSSFRPNEVTDLRAFNKQSIAMSSKLSLAKVTCVRSSDLGNNDQQFECLTHLGHILKPGDEVLGYDPSASTFIEHVKIKAHQVPELILVRKHYPHRKNRTKQRKFELKRMAIESSDKKPTKTEEANAQQEFEEFQQDIEEDPELQSKINLYKKKGVDYSNKNKNNKNNDDMDEEDEDTPGVAVDQLLDGMENMSIGLKPLAGGNDVSEDDIDDAEFNKRIQSLD